MFVNIICVCCLALITSAVVFFCLVKCLFFSTNVRFSSLWLAVAKCNFMSYTPNAATLMLLWKTRKYKLCVPIPAFLSLNVSLGQFSALCCWWWGHTPSLISNSVTRKEVMSLFSPCARAFKSDFPQEHVLGIVSPASFRPFIGPGVGAADTEVKA